MLRTHDVVLAEGTFRLALTPRHRVVAAIDAPHTALGPIHVAVEIDRRRFMPIPVDPHPLYPMTHETAGFFGDIGHAFGDVGHAIGKAAEGTFNAASHVATTIARPAFDIVKHAAAEGAHLIAQATPLLPSAARNQLEQASHVILRARLGDLNAKQFIQGIAQAAKAGVQSAQHVADSLLDATKHVARIVDVPVMLASHVPILGDVLHSISPMEKYQHMISALQQGDFGKLKDMAQHELSLMQSAASMIPGIGTGFSAALSAGLAALQGGSPLEIAVRTAYGAIPIPPGIRSITDPIVDAVIALASHPGNFTDAAVEMARHRIPHGIPRHVFDTLVHLVAHHTPLQKAGAALLDQYVARYAPLGIGHQVSDIMRHLPSAIPAMPALGAFSSFGPANQIAGALQQAVSAMPHAPLAASIPNGTALASQAMRMVQPLHAFH